MLMMMIPRQSSALVVLIFFMITTACWPTVCSAFTASPQTASGVVTAARHCQKGTSATLVVFVNKGNAMNDSNSDIIEEDGPAYTGRGGMGQPQGTVNTYVIDGMDEMSPAEYQAALQESVLERQRQRQRSGLSQCLGK
jgi:hypothetical protein